MSVKIVKLSNLHRPIDTLVNLPFGVSDVDCFLIQRMHDDISRRYSTHENSPLMLKALEERQIQLCNNYDRVKDAYKDVGEPLLDLYLTPTLVFGGTYVQVLGTYLYSPLHDCASLFTLPPIALTLSEDFKTWKGIGLLDEPQCDALENAGILSPLKYVWEPSNLWSSRQVVKL